MSELISVIEKMNNLLSLNPATVNDVKAIEDSLGVILSDEYKEYLLQYGAILADDVELTGFAKSQIRNVVSVTKKEWTLNSKVPHDLYVIENLGMDGVIIWQNSKGEIYVTTPTSRPKMIYATLAEYLKAK